MRLSCKVLPLLLAVSSDLLMGADRASTWMSSCRREVDETRQLAAVQVSAE